MRGEAWISNDAQATSALFVESILIIDELSIMEYKFSPRRAHSFGSFIFHSLRKLSWTEEIQSKS